MSAVVDGSTIHLAWTVPSEGGKTEILRLERQGSVWNVTGKASAQLSAGIPPLSGDCQLFRDDSGWLTVRTGFESYALATIDPIMSMNDTAMFVPTMNTEPLFVWKDHEFFVRRTKYDEASGTYDAEYVLKNKTDGAESVDLFKLRDITSPFIGVPFNGGVLVAPVSKDPANPTIDVAWRSPAEALRIVASVPRTSTEPVYSARAFVRDDKAYVAWTEFHEAEMDLWIAATDVQQSGAKSLVHKVVSPRRIFSFPRRSQ